MRQRKSTPPSLPFLRGGISLPKNSVIRAKIPVSQSLSAKETPPRATGAFGLPLSGNNPSAQRKQGTCKKALNFVQIYRQIACPNLQEPEECRIFVVRFESGRGWAKNSRLGCCRRGKQGSKTRGTAPLLRNRKDGPPGMWLYGLRSLFHGEVEALQVFVERRGTAEQLVAAGTSAKLVDGIVVVFEGFAVERDGGRLGLAGLQQ